MEIGKGVQVDNNFPWNQGNFHTTMFSAKIEIYFPVKKFNLLWMKVDWKKVCWNEQDENSGSSKLPFFMTFCGQSFKIFHMFQTKTVETCCRRGDWGLYWFPMARKLISLLMCEQWKYEIQGLENMKYYLSPHLDCILKQRNP